jgi:tRNA(Ile)-lysidine synthase
LIIKKIIDFFEKYNISLKNKKICVCFSGGADSVALLSAMCLMNESKEFSLCAVHVNHSIRGDESDRDEAFCKEYCERKSIPFYSQRVYAVEESQRNGIGIESAARKLRYQVFEKLKAEKKIDFFLTLLV